MNRRHLLPAAGLIAACIAIGCLTGCSGKKLPIPVLDVPTAATDTDPESLPNKKDGDLRPTGPSSSDKAITDGPGKYAIAEAADPGVPKGPGEYSELVDWSVWEPARSKYLTELDAFRAKADPAVYGAVTDFAMNTSPGILAAPDPDGNAAYSPVSMYAAMCMLARCANNGTYDSIAGLMGLGQLNETEAMNALMHALLLDDGTSILSMANAIWLNSDYVQNDLVDMTTISDISDGMYAGVYEAPLGTETADEAISDWMSDATDELVDASVQTEPNDVALLMDALCFKDSWSETFEKDLTSDENFTKPDGTVIQVPTMHKARDGSAVVTDRYAIASIQSLHGGIRFLLPLETESPAGLLQDPEALSTLMSPDAFDDAPEYNIRWSVPRFDVQCDNDLTDAMLDLGVPLKGNYTRLAPSIEIEVGQIRQISRIKADEDGFEAAAVTIITMKDNAVLLPEEKPVLDMRLDRPFAFCILSEGIPLFVGYVNDPIAGQDA